MTQGDITNMTNVLFGGWAAFGTTETLPYYKDFMLVARYFKAIILTLKFSSVMRNGA